MVNNLKVDYSNFIKENHQYYLSHYKGNERFSLTNFTKREQIQNVRKLAIKVNNDSSIIVRDNKRLPFYYLNKIGKDFTTDALSEYIKHVLDNSRIIYKRDDEAAYTEAFSENGKTIALIGISPFDGTNYSGIDLAHEIGHFYDFENINKDIETEPYELIEVIPMFMEYLMYEKTSPFGYYDFINNRIIEIFSHSGLNDIFMNSNKFAQNTHMRASSKYVLSSQIQYICAFNYVIELIKRREYYKRLVDSQIAKVLHGNINSLDMAENLDIDVSNFRPLKKTFRKWQLRGVNKK